MKTKPNKKTAQRSAAVKIKGKSKAKIALREDTIGSLRKAYSKETLSSRSQKKGRRKAPPGLKTAKRKGKIHKVVYTGGPCSGKSSGIPFVAERLRQMGRRVITVHEVATLILLSGIYPIDFEQDIGLLTLAVEHLSGKAKAKARSDLKKGIYPRSPYSSEEFQECLVRTAIRLEAEAEYFAEKIAAATGEDVIILLDRGLLDGLAYVSRTVFSKILTAHQLTIGKVLGDRYSFVIHMVTAAIGTKNYNRGNKARSETPEQAAYLDEKTKNAWLGHNHIAYIDNNRCSFKRKLIRLFQATCRAVGIPEPIEEESKYIVEPISTSKIPALVRTADIVQIYLRPQGGFGRRIRARTLEGHTVYFYTEKKATGKSGERLEREAIITLQEFTRLSFDRDPSKGIIKKRRHLFEWEGTYWEYDRYDHDTKLATLEAEFSYDDHKPKPPKFFTVIKDATDDPHYSNSAIAERIHVK